MFSRKTTEKVGVRETYLSDYFDGKGLIITDKQDVHDRLRNLLIQGEVHRLDTKDQLGEIAASLKQLIEVQTAILDELRKR
uniref:hypothetical protein n=1 Tax=Brucella pseudintermedia TaxID=370111 RepID=UPI00158E3FFD|nr:hypothetical protein [Brucella pseudintermedia]